MPHTAMATNWWVRPRFDGGCDYVRLCSHPPQPGVNGRVEWVEGSHLPPQMPLLKRRFWVQAEQVQLRQHQLEASGFKPGQPIF